ncbi:MAG: ABC transporter ATP-binding protein [Natronincolaceae bacterium]|jgi:ATP-binding cassette subfamily B multidrug efflux pump|nr:ABC transporter ATP-binding protein [Bacillota bacterium]
MEKNRNYRQLRPSNPRETLTRLFRYFKFNRALFLWGIFFIILGSVSMISVNAMLSPAIDTLIEDGNIALFIKYLIIMAIIVIFLALGDYLGNLFMVQLAQKTVHKIRRDMFANMEKLPISFFDRHTHGELMSTFTNDIDMLNQALEQNVSQIVRTIVTFTGSLAMMIFLSPTLTLVIVLMLIIMFFTIKFIGERSSRNFRIQQHTLADINGYVEEMMSGQTVVKVFNYETRAIEEFNENNEKLRKASTLAATYGVMLMPVMGSLSYTLYALVSMIGALFIITGRLSVGNIASFLQYTRTVSRPIIQVSNQLNTLFAALAGAERIFKMLDENAEIDRGKVELVKDLENNESYWRIPKGNDEYEMVPLRGFITFNDVTFGYTPERNVLKNISLYAKPGQKIAFVGSTGAGKTTITNLINRFYEINEGSILYDGINIKDIKKHDLRSTMGIVLQDVNLFEDTIAENIRYGRLDATDEEVVEAAKFANAHYFITNLAKGYDTMLTADGQNLSQGERQLLSIARAAIADPTILILDEATSSVDTRTERLIEEGMNKLMEGRTTFVIAHRLSTVRNSNAIMVLEHGEILERGDHDDLMEQRGQYYDLNIGAIDLE